MRSNGQSTCLGIKVAPDGVCILYAQNSQISINVLYLNILGSVRVCDGEVADEITLGEDNILVGEREGLYKLAYKVAVFGCHDDVESEHFYISTLDIVGCHLTGSLYDEQVFLHERQFGVLRYGNIQCSVFAVPVEGKVATGCVSVLQAIEVDERTLRVALIRINSFEEFLVLVGEVEDG